MATDCRWPPLHRRLLYPTRHFPDATSEVLLPEEEVGDHVQVVAEG